MRDGRPLADAVTGKRDMVHRRPQHGKGSNQDGQQLRKIRDVPASLDRVVRRDGERVTMRRDDET